MSKTELFPETFNAYYVPMLDKTNAIVEDAKAKVAAEWENSFVARNSPFQGGAVAAPAESSSGDLVNRRL